jgi:hypothetical protein
MDMQSQQVLFWQSSLGISIISIVGLAVLAFLSWGMRRMFNCWRSRIVLKQEPIVEVLLVRRTAGQLKPSLIIVINLRGMEIFTRQGAGYFWLTGTFAIPNKEAMKFKTEKMPYGYFMNLEVVHSFQSDLPDWSFWEDKGQSLKEAGLTSYLHINDRTCRLTRSKKPSNVELREQ